MDPFHWSHIKRWKAPKGITTILYDLQIKSVCKPAEDASCDSSFHSSTGTNVRRVEKEYEQQPNCKRTGTEGKKNGNKRKERTLGEVLPRQDRIALGFLVVSHSSFHPTPKEPAVLA